MRAGEPASWLQVEHWALHPGHALARTARKTVARKKVLRHNELSRALAHRGPSFLLIDREP
jgi:hypothetical protein